MDTEVLEGYKIKTEKFEGPFGLLLSLIENRKLFINDISLAQVTEDYLNYVNSLDGSKTREISSFIVIAATLILIKSKSLLPTLDLSTEEEKEITNLEDRLKLFEKYSNLSLNIQKLFGKNIIFPLAERNKKMSVFVPDDMININMMHDLALELLNKIPKKVELPEVEVKKVISIEEMIENLSERIQRSVQVNFREFAGRAVTKEERVNVIVGFLAMLELVRQGILNVMQDNNFEDILLEKKTEENEEENLEENNLSI
jgi:segregation and condensation protein A